MNRGGGREKEGQSSKIASGSSLSNSKHKRQGEGVGLLQCTRGKREGGWIGFSPFVNFAKREGERNGC
jgi:hypothetical protein